MLMILIALGTGIVLFLCFVLGYREGLRLGMRSAKGIEPRPIENPVTAIKDHFEAKKEQKKAQELFDEWEEFENFDGYTEEERKLMNKGGDE
jgi:hypothetical protein